LRSRPDGSAATLIVVHIHSDVDVLHQVPPAGVCKSALSAGQKRTCGGDMQPTSAKLTPTATTCDRHTTGIVERRIVNFLGEMWLRGGICTLFNMIG